MKQKILFIIAILLTANMAFAQNDAISRFFKQYENDQNFTVISISPKMFKMMSKVKWDNVSNDVKQAINQLTSFRMLTSEKKGIKFYNEAIQKLNLASYDEIMKITGSENIKFYVKEANSRINELVMLVGTQKEFVLMSLTGIIELDKINKIGAVVNLNGMDRYLSSVR